MPFLAQFQEKLSTPIWVSSENIIMKCVSINALSTETGALSLEAGRLEKMSKQDFGWMLKIQVCVFIVPQCIKEEGYNKELALILYIRMSLFPWWLLWARSNMKLQQWSEYIFILPLWHGLYLSSLTKSKHCGGAIKSQQCPILPLYFLTLGLNHLWMDTALRFYKWTDGIWEGWNRQKWIMIYCSSCGYL